MIFFASACCFSAAAGFVFGWLAHAPARVSSCESAYWRTKYETLKDTHKRLQSACKAGSKDNPTRQ